MDELLGYDEIRELVQQTILAPDALGYTEWLAEHKVSEPAIEAIGCNTVDVALLDETLPFREALLRIFRSGIAIGMLLGERQR